MTAMVQPNLGPPTPKYQKEDPPQMLDDPNRQNQSSQQPQQPHGLQHPRSTSISQQHRQLPKSPHQADPSLQQNAYAQPQPQPQSQPQPQLLGNGVQLPRQSPYGPPGQEPAYYTSHPGAYAVTSTPGQYPSSEAPELMAATAHMQRPYPPIYHTPQSSSPASVASPQTHDQHGRSLYGQPPQIPQGMYGYPQYAPPMNPIHPSSYPPHPGNLPHTQLTTQPLPGNHPAATSQMQPMHQPPQQQQQQQQQQPPPQHHGAMTSPRLMKLESTVNQHTPAQRTPLNASHAPPAGPPGSGNNAHSSSASGSSSGAAPGPIPATTPLVVRQDNSGVQWIAFEYSRDRVKMEYTIRCDVENISIEGLPQDFKTENCVYPRACCTKDQYRGNRLVYETECNAVGWALAELNPCLRAKRGLIQRAVDSWRNSHQDPRLRSRRVRRMAKANNRKAVSTQHTNPMAGSGGPGAPTMPGSAGLNTSPNLTMGGPTQLHHHHANPDGSTNTDDVSGSHEYSNGTHRPAPTTASYPPGPSPADSRPAQIFHGYPSYPSAAASNNPAGPSMVPPLRDAGLDHFGKNATIATSGKPDHEDETSPETTSQFRDLPEGKRRKFILVEDPQRDNRVRVKVMLDQVDMKEIPDSYRKSNSVFPRTYFPVHSPFGQTRRGGRFSDEEHEGGDNDGADADVTLGRTVVPAPMLDGEGTVAVPKLAKRKRDKEALLNDMGYRMSWGQSRVFAGRPLFLQRSLDAYRNKMRSTMLNAGHETTEIAPHFETRVGKRRWLERSKRASSIDGAGTPAAVTTSASSRSAEEVEP